jgi:hypothetical protein
VVRLYNIGGLKEEIHHIKTGILNDNLNEIPLASLVVILIANVNLI